MKTNEEYEELALRIYDAMEHGEHRTMRSVFYEVELAAYRSGMEQAANICKSAEDSYGAYYCAEMIEAAAKTAQLPNVSKCCSDSFTVQNGDEGTQCYVCQKCGNPCDPKTAQLP